MPCWDEHSVEERDPDIGSLLGRRPIQEGFHIAIGKARSEPTNAPIQGLFTFGCS